MVWMTHPEAELPRMELPQEVAADPAPERQRRRGAWALFNEVYDALGKLGPEFVRSDVCRVLGYEPDRSSLQRVLKEFEEEGMIAQAAPGSGRVPARWVKVAHGNSGTAQGS